MASPETVPRDLDETTVTIIQDTPERRLAVLGEIDEAYGRDVRAGASHHDHTARACTKRGKYTPPPGPTPGAYLAGRHTLIAVVI